MNPESGASVLMAHCYYASRGGEDESFEAESRLLAASGQPVTLYTRDNGEIAGYGAAERLRLGWRTVWAFDTCSDLRETLARERPYLAHFQNTFPLISPAAYSACRKAGVPVVQTLRNYRPLCPKATFLRRGRNCEDCLGRFVPWPGVVHRCYRGSRVQTTPVAAMLATHNLLGTWHRQVDVFVTPTSFTRSKFIAAGFPSRKIVVKPNFIEDPGPPTVAPMDASIVYVGRLSEEKGVEDLIRAIALLRSRPRLRIIGDGPSRDALVRLAADTGVTDVGFTGWLPAPRLLEELRKTSLVVVPSRCYETFGRVIVEAFACGRPVIVARHGALEELVRDSQTGFGSEPGSPESLAAAIERALADPDGLRRMGVEARRDYEANYTPEANYKMLMGIYRLALERAGKTLPRSLRFVPKADPGRSSREWIRDTA